MQGKRIGKYELMEELGRGAMGVVYKAHDTLLNREVALKIMLHTEQGSTESKRRFYREAQSAGSLMHDNIVKVFDLGEESGVVHIVMEYLPGQDLKQILADGKLTSYREILKIWLQICSGLHHAHKRGLVHRDIKPGNIRITPGGRVKIMDFGIAKKPSSDLTQSGVVLGTVDYMAPEQVKGLGADVRSDVFSMGVMFYEMLTGRKPFPGDSVTSVIYKIVYEDPDPLGEITIDCPPDTERIVRRLLHKDPQTRYASAMEVARDLKESYTAWRGASTQGHAAVTPSMELPRPPEEEATIAAAPRRPPTPAPVVDPERTVMAGPPPRHAEPTPPRFQALATPPRAVPPPVPPTPPGSWPAAAQASPPTARPATRAPAPPVAAVSVEDLPMRPHETGPYPGDIHYQSPTPYSAETIQEVARPRSRPDAHTVVDLEPPRPITEEHRRARISPFWIGMVMLFVTILVGGGLAVKLLAPSPVEAPSTPSSETPAPLPSVKASAPLAPPKAPKPARLFVDTNVPAAILIDGRVSGQAPTTEPLLVPPGPHRIEVKELTFGSAREQSFEAAEDQEHRLSLPFEGDGFVTLKVRPWANVIIDGNKSKSLEVMAVSRPLPLPAGKHVFEFEQLKKSTTREVYVVPGKTVEIEVDMASISRARD